MKSFFSYILQSKTYDFLQKPFNTIDALVLTGLIYLPFEQKLMEDNKITTLDEALKIYLAEKVHPVRTFTPTLDQKFAEIVYNSTRYGSLYLSDYLDINDIQEQAQFSVITIFNDTNLLVTFMGTDNSFNGWDENLNMCYEDITPSQKKAAIYLNYIADKYPGKNIYISGHSKGGNLAMFALTFARSDVKERVRKCYNFDGPGLTKKIIESDEYKSVRKKMLTYVPYYSFVGIIFEHSDNFKVIKATRLGIFQHAFYYWQVKNNDLVYHRKISRLSKRFHNGISDFIDKMTFEERKTFVAKIDEIFKSVGAKNLNQIVFHWPYYLLRAIVPLNKLTKKEKKILYRSLRVYVKGILRLPERQRKERKTTSKQKFKSNV